MLNPKSTSLLAVLILVGCFFVCGAILYAIDVSVTATVPPPPDTTVQFSGIAYPNADIVILEDGNPFLTGSANAQADFALSQGSVTPGLHTYTLTAEDAQGRFSPVYSVVVNVVFEATTTISNIFFGPTIQLNTTSITLGQTITVSGITSPSSSVTIHLIKGSTTNYTVTAHATTGAWTRSFTGELSTGSYTVNVEATDPDTTASELSNTLSFTVQPTPDPCLAANVADLNCDGEVDLTDLSILLSYWLQSSPGNPRADINGDTTVNVIDFSIMMYHWTGPV